MSKRKPETLPGANVIHVPSNPQAETAGPQPAGNVPMPTPPEVAAPRQAAPPGGLDSDEVPYVPPIFNPTPTKPTLDFEVIDERGHRIRGRFVDESAAISWHVSAHGTCGAHPPQVVCHTEPRIPSVYQPAP